MLIVANGTLLSISNPLLTFMGVTAKGFLADVAELSFQVFRGATQVYPVTPGNKQAVNVVTDRVGLGRYAATWTVPSATDTPGRYEVRWFYKFDALDTESSCREAFEVVATLDAAGPFYAGPADLVTDEAVAGVAVSRLLQALSVAGAMIERFTRTFFEPRHLTVAHDGKGGDMLHLQHAIVAIETVLEDDVEVTDLANSLVVYNRHLRGLTSPNDRGNPKLVWRSGNWARGAQNFEVRGVFGSMEQGSALWGRPMAMARHAAKLIAVRELGVMGDADVRDAAQNRYRVVSESTRDQSYTMTALTGRGGPAYLTGDPEIDQILMALRGPMRVVAT